MLSIDLSPPLTPPDFTVSEEGRINCWRATLPIPASVMVFFQMPYCSCKAIHMRFQLDLAVLACL